MRTFKSLMISLCMGTTLCMCLPQTTTAQTVSSGDSWTWDKGTIVIDTPERPTGQKSVLGLTTPKMEVVRVGFVGLGMRGPGAVERFTYIPGTQIVALCDYEASRAEKCQDILKKASMPKAAIYSGEKGYEELCKRTDIDLVYIAADWLHHFPVAKCALENGKNVAIEVPSETAENFGLPHPAAGTGVCQSIQRYKTTEEELTAARDNRSASGISIQSS